MPRLVSIVLGPEPSRLKPILLSQLEALAARRSDVGLRLADTGTKAKRETLLVDPTGRVPGELLFIDGRLQIPEPKPATLGWMIELAQELGGRVRDSSLRTYRTPRDTYHHPDDEAARLQLAKAIREARKVDNATPRTKLWAVAWWSVIVIVVAAAATRLLATS